MPSFRFRIPLSLAVASLCSLLALGRASPALAAPGATPLEDKTLSPYFFVDDGDPRIDSLPLHATKVDVAVSGVIADVTVTQSYENAGQRPINARYVFPASTRAAVHGLTMTIGKQVIEAKIKEREQATREFEREKRAGKSVTLLEQERPNVFTMNVANVMPGDHLDVTLRYTELLVPTDGTYEFVYPAVVGPRYSNQPEATAPKTDRFVASPYLPEGAAPTSTFELAGTIASGIPIRSLDSPTHELHQESDNAGLSRFSIEDAGKKGNDRDFVLRYGLAGDAIQTGLSLYDAGGEKFFLLMVEPPKRVAPDLMPPREYVFVLDVSGSMEGFPLDTAKKVLRELARTLRPVDKFNVLLFSGTSFLLSPHSLTATKENVASALAAIDKERGGGGTELLPALEQSFALTKESGLSRSFVVVTDGYIGADKGAIDLVRNRLGDANVFAFGIGSSVNRYLIEGLAKAGQGEPFVVTDPADAPRVAARFRDYVASPVLANVRVAYEGFDAYDVEPKSIPDVLAARPVVVHGKYRGPLAGAVTVSGLSGTGVYRQRFDVSKSAPRAENHALSYLWARSRIAALSDYGFAEPGEAERGAIVGLGLRYNLLTQYTSFIAVSHAVRNPGAPATDVDQPLPLPAGVSADAVGGAMQTASEPELVVLAAAVALLAAGTLMRRSRRSMVVA